MKKRLWLLTLLLLLAVVATACGDNELVESEEPPSPGPTVSPTPKPSPSPTPTPEPVVEEVFTNPLTGLESEHEELIRATAPMSFVINNFKAAMPQHGVGEADIIYEVVAEGGITRLLMVEQEWWELGIVGAVRSARNYYVDIAAGHKSVLVHAGASEMAYDMMRKIDIPRLDGTNNTPKGVFYRDAERMKTRSSEHCLMTRGEMIDDYLAGTSLGKRDGELVYPVTFEPDYAIDGGDEVNSIKVKFSNYKTSVFQYSADDERYTVEQFDAPHIDQNSGDQLMVTNLLVLYTDIRLISDDAYDRLEVDLIGSGDGIYCVAGKMVPIKWHKNDVSSPFTYTAADGDEQIFRAGNSYICIIEGEKQVTTVK